MLEGEDSVNEKEKVGTGDEESRGGDQPAGLKCRGVVRSSLRAVWPQQQQLLWKVQQRIGERLPQWEQRLWRRGSWW